MAIEVMNVRPVEFITARVLALATRRGKNVRERKFNWIVRDCGGRTWPQCDDTRAYSEKFSRGKCSARCSSREK